jgi:hypothetical protein
MSGQAEQLQQLIAFFQLGTEQPASKPRAATSNRTPRPAGSGRRTTSGADTVDESHFEKF